MEAVAAWEQTVSSHLPALSKPQARMLARWSYGVVLAVLTALLIGCSLPTARFVPEPWPTDVHHKPTLGISSPHPVSAAHRPRDRPGSRTAGVASHRRGDGSGDSGDPASLAHRRETARHAAAARRAADEGQHAPRRATTRPARRWLAAKRHQQGAGSGGSGPTTALALALRRRW